jgi:hypothetical protein
MLRTSTTTAHNISRPHLLAGFTVVTVLLAVYSVSLLAGHRNFRNQAVGGISIDAEGVIREADVRSKKMLLDELRKDIQRAPQALMAPTGLRMVSLRGLQHAIADAQANNLGRLPDEVRFLAGLQRIQYILVYPEQQDIVLAGPGEGWRVDENANVVGVTTGRPVIQLDHLLTALRTADAARQVGITCSIDPTEAGMQKLQTLLDHYRKNGIAVNPRVMEPQMKQAFGPQQVRITGVPGTSYFARVMVAADYKMKRIAMKLDPSPVKGLPSFIDMIKGRSVRADVNPRWWLACDYEPLARSEDGLAWELKGQGVKAMTENEIVQAGGDVKQAGTIDPLAQKWADMMTARYDALSAADPVFGELRNVMDLCVVAALIKKEGLMEKAGLDMAALAVADNNDLQLDVWHAPTQVAAQCSFVKSRSNWILTASGGVDVNSWEVASKVALDPSVKETWAKGNDSDHSQFWWQ